MANSWIVL